MSYEQLFIAKTSYFAHVLLTFYPYNIHLKLPSI